MRGAGCTFKGGAIARDSKGDCLAFGATLTTDVRGGVRPLDGNADGIAACDLGAVESDELFTNGFE